MPVAHNTEQFLERIEACRDLYLKHGGKDHEMIEKEMRELGYKDFHRRNLYRRFERGSCRPGWIETYGWNSLLRNADRGLPIEDKTETTKEHETAPNIAATTNPRSAIGDPLSNDFDEFKEWLKRVSPGMTWEWKHQVYIYKRLKRVTDGDCKRLMIFLPPRHGKSELVTVRYAAWRLKQDPSMRVIIGSYNQTLANNFSRGIKRVLCEDHELSRGEEEKGRAGEQTAPTKQHETTTDANGSSTRHLPVSPSPSLPVSPSSSPFPFVKTRPKNTEAEWETTMGGGLKAVGVGSGVTGYGADLIIIDDPVKSRAEAESKTFRDRLWNWFNNDLYTRLEPDGSIILIQTRWHEDDLAGRLLRKAQEADGEHWDVISLPALAEPPAVAGGLTQPPTEFDDSKSSLANGVGETELANNYFQPPATAGGSDTTDPLGRKVGEALCPDRFNEKKLGQYSRDLGSYTFAALYQQRPSPAEGGMFRREWFKITNFAPPDLKWKRGYDLGISKNPDADYTASLKTAYDAAGNLYIDGAYRARIEYPEQRRYILGRINAEPGIDHGVELSANGNAVIQDLRRENNIQGRTLRGIKVTADKFTRALGWLALAEEGKVHLIRGAWNDEFIDEAASFPQGRHDDQIDAVSLTIQMHREQKGRSHGFTWKELYGK